MTTCTEHRRAAVRCAIYTRKSSEEGLEQSFNSLDAQREACAAYILSQASEGWTEVNARYDDGGLSGGTLERPALQRLLVDIASGKIDIIVVYKVDRLTRSLFDFAKLVERFDEAGISFVSVTQSFNTTTSIGRLTLNMLLSFAQFEREVTAERIRDKIAASKAKGMWMGGVPPLGYKPDGRSLTIVEEHAALVRLIYARYLELGNVRLLAAALEAEDILCPRRVLASGRSTGGSAFTRTQLYTLLANRIYLGKIVHKEQTFPGLHPPIISATTFDAVQASLKANLQGQRSPARAARPSLLAGKLVDEDDVPLIATHAGGEVRYRYYISRTALHGQPKHGLRLPAREIELAVTERLATLFDDPVELAARAWLAMPVETYRPALARAAEIATRLRQREHAITNDLVCTVRVSLGALKIEMTTARIAAALQLQQSSGAPPNLTVETTFRLTRSGQALRLVQADGTLQGAKPNVALVRLIAQGHRYWRELKKGELQIGELAEKEGISRAYVARLVRLAFLSPQVVEAVLAGRQRVGLNAETIKAINAIDPNWTVQAATFLSIGR